MADERSEQGKSGCITEMITEPTYGGRRDRTLTMTANGPSDTIEKSVEVRVYGSRLKLLPQGDTAIVPYISGESVNALLMRLGIPEEEVFLLVVNEALVTGDFILSPGDKVGVMSPVGGG